MLSHQTIWLYAICRTYAIGMRVVGSAKTCREGYFQCLTGPFRCIPESMVCDGVTDCVDESDEFLQQCQDKGQTFLIAIVVVAVVVEMNII